MLNKALMKIGRPARRKAFRNNRPVAISENGKTILLYPNGSKRAVTPEILRELSHANS